jgi:hypothetical protein
MKETDESPDGPADDNVRPGPIQSFLWIAIPIAVMALIIWFFWP